MNKLIIDHYEGSYAVCAQEDKTTINIPKYKIPLGCKEGDCLILNSDLMYQKDTGITIKKKVRISDFLNRLFNNEKEIPGI